MSLLVETSFVKHYQAEVHEAFQRQGSKLRGSVRTKNNVKGSSTVFQKVGKGSASTKTRNSSIPIMNIPHGVVEIFLQDFYAGDWLDKLDELKINHDEKIVIASTGAYALGRKADELIIRSMDQDSTIYDAGNSTQGMTLQKILNAFEYLGEKDVPDDGDRYAVVGWKQWSDLLQISEFTNADYVGDGELPWRGTQAKKWLGTYWIPHSGLLKTTNVRHCYWYHKTAIAHAIANEVETDITWHGDHAAYFINNMMSQGAGVIDGEGVVRIKCKE